MNDMADKSTVISIIPFELRESKPGQYPPDYIIPAAPKDDFSFIVVEQASAVMYLGFDRGGGISVPISSNTIAKDLCECYQKSKLGYEAGEREPGLFWIDGEYRDKKAILAVAKDKLERARILQKNWYFRLVEIADDSWNQYHTHKSISDEMRNACDFLGLSREWNIKGAVDSIERCPACSTVIPNTALVCPNCKTIIKPEEYAKKGFKVA